MATDLTIEVPNEPGGLAKVAAAVADAGVNLSGATCDAGGTVADLHILVKYPEAAKRALATTGLTVTRQRDVIVVEAEDRPGVLADLARKVAEAGINISLLYVATGTRVVFGADDIDGLREALGPFVTEV